MKLRYLVSGLIMASLLLGACQPEVVEVIKEVPVEWHNCTSSKVHVIWSPVQMFRDLIRIRVNAFRGIYKQRCE